MKTLLAALSLIVVFAAQTRAQTNWSLPEQEQIMSICLQGANHIERQEDKESVCSCLLFKLMDKYPNYAAADKYMTEEEFVSWANVCENELAEAAPSNAPNPTSGDFAAQVSAGEQMGYRMCQCGKIADETKANSCFDALLAESDSYTAKLAPDAKAAYLESADKTLVNCLFAD